MTTYYSVANAEIQTWLFIAPTFTHLGGDAIPDTAF